MRYVEDISERGGKLCVENGAQVIFIFHLPSPIKNQHPIKWIGSVLRKLFTHSSIHSFGEGPDTTEGTADRMVRRADSLTLIDSPGEQANTCTGNFTAG